MVTKTSREESVVEDRKTKTEACSSEDWRGNSAEITAGGISTSSNAFIIITMIKGNRLL
jgi:hypothetical protein